MAIYRIENKPLGKGNASSFEARSKEMVAMKVGQSFAFPASQLNVVRGDITRLHNKEKAKHPADESKRMAWGTEREGEAYRCGRLA